MGLDMYMSVRKYVNRIDFSQDYDKSEGYMDEPKFTSVIEATDMAQFLEPEDSVGLYVEVPVMYWRKANAIHKWFVDERADGVDNCQPIPVNVSHLEELLGLCDKALANRENAHKYLPTTEGFFFGGIEYDEWYFDGLEYTQRRLRELIPMMERSGNDWAVYQASW